MSLPNSILDILPLEVVELVLDEVKQDDKFTNSLRLVCKALNEIVEPQAFSTTTITFNPKNVDIVEDKLAYLASGSGPHSRWAKRLRIIQLITVADEDVMWWDPFQGDIRERMLECQTNWLVPAIQGLKQVERVEAYISTRGPSHDVFCALADLPRLQQLSVEFGVVSGEKPINIPMARLSNLTTLALINLPISPSVLEGVKKMIAQSPTLVDLKLRAWNGLSTQLSSLLTPETPTTLLPPRLKKLSVPHDGVFLSAPCVPFLRSLTHLDISAYYTEMDPLFWKAMQYDGVQLESLVTPGLNQPTVDYLLSYSGLQELTVDWSSKGEDEATAQRLFSFVLPRHRDTLEVFACKNATLGPWCITAPRLEQIYLCQMLRRLDLVYYFPSPDERVVFPIFPLDTLFSSISRNLPLLQELRINHTQKPKADFESAHTAHLHWKGKGRSLALAVHKTVFSLPSPEEKAPRFYLRAMNVTFSAVKDARAPGKCRFMIDDPAKYGFHELLESNEEADNGEADRKVF